MCVDDIWRILTAHEPHVAVLLEPESLFRDFLDLVEVEVLARCRVGDGNEGTAAESTGEVVDDAGEKMAAKVVGDGVDGVQLLMVEDVDDLRGHLLAFVGGGRGGLVGAAVAEEVGNEDAIA